MRCCRCLADLPPLRRVFIRLLPDGDSLGRIFRGIGQARPTTPSFSDWVIEPFAANGVGRCAAPCPLGDRRVARRYQSVLSWSPTALEKPGGPIRNADRLSATACCLEPWV